jgi:hypothetical protein
MELCLSSMHGVLRRLSSVLSVFAGWEIEIYRRFVVVVSILWIGSILTATLIGAYVCSHLIIRITCCVRLVFSGLH